MAFFFMKEPLWKHVYSHVILMQFLYFNNRLNKVRTKLKNAIKSFEMTSNSKHRTDIIKTKNQNRNMKDENVDLQKE